MRYNDLIGFLSEKKWEKDGSFGNVIRTTQNGLFFLIFVLFSTAVTPGNENSAFVYGRTLHSIGTEITRGIAVYEHVGRTLETN